MKTSLLLLGALSVLLASCHGDVPVYKGQFFKYPLDKYLYSAEPTLKDQQVSFQFTTEDQYPSLPTWVHLEQGTVDSPAMLYGSAHEWDETTTVEIIGWDKLHGYKTIRKTVVFDVVPNKDGFPWFQAEFLVSNMNLDDFLENGNETQILKIVKENYFPAKDLQVTLVESALNRGGRIPLPHSNKSIEVYVRVGSHESVNETSPKYHLQNGTKPKMDAFVSGGNNYIIDWSAFTWLDLRSIVSPVAHRQGLLPKDKIITTVDYTPREFDDSPRDFDNDFVLVIILPIIIIIILVILLSLIMCFGREGRKNRDDKTPNIQLTHHHNIQRSTLRLRELSKPGDHDQTSPHTPSDDTSRPHCGQNEYSRLAEEGDDDRNEGRNAPPPYRMPPGGGATGGQQV